MERSILAQKNFRVLTSFPQKGDRKHESKRELADTAFPFRSTIEAKNLLHKESKLLATFFNFVLRFN